MREGTTRGAPGLRGIFAAAALLTVALQDVPRVHAMEPYRTVVTTDRGETPWAEAPRHVLLRDADDIAAEMPIDGAEAVEQSGAVHLQRTNRAAGTPIVRGLVGPQNLIVIDGLRFNLATFRTGPNQYMALLDPNAAAAFEVVPGPGSVLYGGAAMGGVLSMRVRPLRARDGIGGRVRLGFDTADQAREAALDVSARDGKLAGWAGLSLRQHDELTVGGGERLTGTDYQMLDGRARVGLDLDGGWRLTATWLGNATPDATRLDQLPRGDARRYDNRLQTGWVDVERESRGALRHLRLSARVTQLDERVDRWRCDRAGDGLVLQSDACARRDPSQINRYRDYEDRTRSVGGLAQGRFALLGDALGLTAGAEVWHDRVSSSMREATRSNDFVWVDKRGNYSDGGRYTEAGLFAQAGYALYQPSAERKLELIAGGRLNHVMAAADDVPGLGEVDYTFTGLSSTAGLVWTMDKSLAAWLRYDSGFRAPNLQETTVLGDTGSTFEVPNDALNPEQSHTVELGARAQNKLLRGSIAGWWTRIDGIIVGEAVGADACIEQGTIEGDSCVVDGKPVRRLTNGDQATFMGVTLHGDTRPLAAGFGLYGRLMWIDGEIEKVGGGTSNPRRLPPLQGRAGLSWRDPGEQLIVGLHTTFAARQDKLNDSDRSDLRVCADPAQPNRVLGDCAGTPGWATLGVMARWRLTDKVSVFGRGENLLDARYRVHGSGFDAPGLSIRLGAQADL